MKTSQIIAFVIFFAAMCVFARKLGRTSINAFFGIVLIGAIYFAGCVAIKFLL